MPELKKPEPHSRLRGREKRDEARRIRIVYGIVDARDGRCRLGRIGARIFFPCRGWGQLAHMTSHRRSTTVGMSPEERHRPDKTLKLCEAHHAAYDKRVLSSTDRHYLTIEELTERGADGRLAFSYRGIRVEED